MLKSLSLGLALLILPFFFARAEDTTFSSLRAAIRADITAQQHPRADGSPPSDRVNQEQAALSALEEASFDSGNRAERSLKLLLGTNLPDPLRSEVSSALAQIQNSRAQEIKAAKDQLETAMQRTNAVLLKAKTAKELDSALIEMRRIGSSRRSGYSDAARDETQSRAQEAARFLQRWQDYLWAMESGKFSNALSLLNELAANEQNPFGIPRSEILGRARALEDTEKNQVKTVASPIVQKIQTLDDLPAAVQALHADQALFRSNELSSLASALEGLCRTYLAFKEGIATTINMSYSGPGDAYPIVTRLRAELLLRVLPRILEVQENNQPKAGETVDAYLQRLSTAARAAGDFELLGRVISIQRQIVIGFSGAANPNVNDDYTAFLAFRDGQNEERAHQFTDAVMAYRRALRFGSTTIPAEFIGQRLEALKKEHSDDYDRAINMPQRDEGHFIPPRGYPPSGELKVPPVSPPPPIVRTATPAPSRTPAPTPPKS